jgi:hypothetical protein
MGRAIISIAVDNALRLGSLIVEASVAGNRICMGIRDDDETHPIPHLGKIDVAVDLMNGGY